MKQIKKILVSTGAGISVASGIHPFRGSNGLWENSLIEEIATYAGWQRNPKKIFEFYKKLSETYESKLPTEAHKALVLLENAFGINFNCITQNADGLHEKAGLKNLIHLHGTLDVININDELFRSTFKETPEYKFGLRPNIVLFGEMPKLTVTELLTYTKDCDLYLSIGTSDNVAPANNTFHKFLPKECHKVQFNIEKTIFSGCYDEIILGDVEKTLPLFVNTVKLSKPLISDHPSTEEVYQKREQEVKDGNGISVKELIKKLREKHNSKIK